MKYLLLLTLILAFNFEESEAQALKEISRPKSSLIGTSTKASVKGTKAIVREGGGSGNDLETFMNGADEVIRALKNTKEGQKLVKLHAIDMTKIEAANSSENIDLEPDKEKMKVDGHFRKVRVDSSITNPISDHLLFEIILYSPDTPQQYSYPLTFKELLRSIGRNDLVIKKIHFELYKWNFGKKEKKAYAMGDSILLYESSFEADKREGFSTYENVADICRKKKTFHRGEYLIVYCVFRNKEWTEWTVDLATMTDYRFLGYTTVETESTIESQSSASASVTSNLSASSSFQNKSPDRKVLWGLYQKRRGSSSGSGSVGLSSSASGANSSSTSEHHYQKTVTPEIRSIEIPYHYFKERQDSVLGLRVYGIAPKEDLVWREIFSSDSILDGIFSLTYPNDREGRFQALADCGEALRTRLLSEKELFTLIGTKCFVDLDPKTNRLFYSTKTLNPFIDLQEKI